MEIRISKIKINFFFFLLNKISAHFFDLQIFATNAIVSKTISS